MNKYIEELKNYNKYSDVAKWKIMILKYGVKFFPLDKFNNYENINSYKTKSRVVNVISKNNEVYDVSKDISVIPSEILISSKGKSSLVKLRYSEKSPIILDVMEENKLCLALDNEKIDIKVELVEKNSILANKIPSNITNNNVCIGDYIDIVGIDRISILFFEGCYNWLSGKPCKFCDLHPQKEEYDAKKPTLNNLRLFDMNVNKWWEFSKKEYLKNLKYSLKYVLDNVKLPHFHIFFMAGNLPTNTQVWNIVEETIEYLSKEIDFSKYDTYLNVAPHDSPERLKKVKKFGIKYLQYNLEIVNEENFNYTCPGKMKYRSFLDKLYEAVQNYGKGRVRSNFVLGLDNINETLRFASIIAKDGIIFDYSVFQPKRNTEYYSKKVPDFEEIVQFTEELLKIYKKYNFKPIFCTLSSRSSIINELYES